MIDVGEQIELVIPVAPIINAAIAAFPALEFFPAVVCRSVIDVCLGSPMLFRAPTDIVVEILTSEIGSRNVAGVSFSRLTEMDNFGCDNQRRG